MTYDAWKLDNPWDSEARYVRMSRVPCEDCDCAVATLHIGGPRPTMDIYLCERCHDRRCGEDEPRDRVFPTARND